MPEGSPNDGPTEDAVVAAPHIAHTELTPEYEVAHAEMPLEPPASGDFHTAFPIPDGSGDVGVVIGDVSGHGPGAGVQADLIRDAITTELQSGSSPAEALAAANGPVEADPAFDGFATVFAGRVEAETGKLRYASGGHEPGLLTSGGVGIAAETVEELVRTGPPLGVVAQDEVRYEEKTATIPEGGTLLLYTDGISEARSPRTRDWFGIARLRKVFSRFAALSPGRLVRNVLSRVLAFCRRSIRDDIVLLALRRRGPNGIAGKKPVQPE